MKRSLSIEIISAILILLFAYTAASKLMAHRHFILVLEQFPFLKPHSRVVGWLLPVAELGMVGLLFFPATKLVGLWSSLVLLLGFTFFLLYMVTFYPHLPCNCGGVLKSMSWQHHIIFNFFFIGLAALGIVLYTRRLFH